MQIQTDPSDLEHVEDLWEDAVADNLDPVERLVYRSNLLGSDWRITNTGGGNTSAKLTETDPITGEEVEVLVEGPSKKHRGDGETSDGIIQMTGRTHCDRIVVFDGRRRQAGHLLPVTVDAASSHTLIGRVKTVEVHTIGTPPSLAKV